VSERGFYDTHAFVKTLVESGDFNQQQAESLCSHSAGDDPHWIAEKGHDHLGEE